MQDLRFLLLGRINLSSILGELKVYLWDKMGIIIPPKGLPVAEKTYLFKVLYIETILNSNSKP